MSVRSRTSDGELRARVRVGYAQEVRSTGYAVRGFFPAPFSPRPSPAHQCVARAADAALRGCGGRRCASWPQAGLGSNQVRGGSHPAPRTPLRCVPLVCHPAFSSGLPEAPLESRSWPAPVSRHRNFRRSATGGTSPDLSSGGSHARHRLDEGVRQSRPGHPGVGRFGLWFPRRSSDQTVRTSAAAFPRRPDGDTVGGRQPPRTEFHAFSLARRRVDLAGPQIFGTPSVPVRRGRYWVVFLLLSYRTARGVSIPARGVHGFLLRHLRTCRDFRFSEARVRAATLLGSGNHDAPKRSSVPLPFAVLRFIYRPGAAGLWPPRHPHPHPPPRGSGVRTELESRPVCRDMSEATCLSLGRTQACHAHLAAAENRSPETSRTEQMAVWTLRLVSEGHLTGVGRPV